MCFKNKLVKLPRKLLASIFSVLDVSKPPESHAFGTDETRVYTISPPRHHLRGTHPHLRGEKRDFFDQTSFSLSTSTETRVIFEVLLKFLFLHRDSKTFLSRSGGHQPISLGSGDKVQKTKRSSQPGEEPWSPGVGLSALRSARLGSAQ